VAVRVFVSYRRTDVSGYSGRLTDALAQLTRRQAVVRDESFHADVDRLLTSLRGTPSDSPVRSSHRRPVIAAAAMLVLIGAGGVAWQVRDPAHSRSPSRRRAGSKKRVHGGRSSSATQMENNTHTSIWHESGKYRSVRVARRDYDTYCFDPPRQAQANGTITDAQIGFIVSCVPGGR
jgi:hypothetical protein